MQPDCSVEINYLSIIFSQKNVIPRFWNG